MLHHKSVRLFNKKRLFVSIQLTMYGTNLFVRTNESWLINAWISHDFFLNMSFVHDLYMNESETWYYLFHLDSTSHCLKKLDMVRYIVWMNHDSYMNESWLIYEWVATIIWLSQSERSRLIGIAIECLRTRSAAVRQWRDLSLSACERNLVTNEKV